MRHKHQISVIMGIMRLQLPVYGRKWYFLKELGQGFELLLGFVNKLFRSL